MRIYVDFDDSFGVCMIIFVWRHPSDSEASPYGEPLN